MRRSIGASGGAQMGESRCSSQVSLGATNRGWRPPPRRGILGNRMRGIPLTVVLSLAMLSTSSPSRAGADVPRTSSLTATISTVRSTKGHIGCALYNSAEGFPASHTAAFRQRWLTIHGKSIECSFERLPPGAYAFAIFHDENDNGLFDTDRLGFPKEGWATSNNAKHLLRAPSFEESRVNLAEGASVHVKVTLRYPW